MKMEMYDAGAVKQIYADLKAKPEEKCYWPYIIRLPANVLISPSKLSARANKVTCCINVG